MIKWPNKDPDEVLDYGFIWTDLMVEGDVITTSEWLPASGINIDSDTHTGDITVVWLSGGAVGDQYDLTNRVTTAAGRVFDRTARIAIKDK